MKTLSGTKISKKKRIAFITGGTGSLGKKLVQAFSECGYKVVFQYNSNGPIARSLLSKHNARPLRIDLSKPFKLPNIRFDVVINNAGVNLTSELTHDVAVRDWDKTLKLNLYAPFLITKTYLPGMLKQNWGRVINISSIYGLRGSENNVPYNVSKHGLSGLTKSVAKEYASFGITCNEICPCAVESQMMNRIAAEEALATRTTSEAYLQSVAESIPAKRMALPEDVAAVALFLASEEANFINGISIPCDGGLIA